MDKLNRFIATGFFIGEKVPAPGTAASIVTAIIYLHKFSRKRIFSEGYQILGANVAQTNNISRVR